MRWHHLLFMHWRFDAAQVQRLLPAGLEVDTFDGAAWIGVVPFTMTGVRARWTPALPRLGAFHEINVRTYVREAGRGSGVESKPGVYFFSLDAAEALAVRMARAVYGLKYFLARMALDHDAEGWIDYSTRRVDRAGAPAEFVGAYRGVGEPRRGEAGSLQHFLTERYCLYADQRGRVRRAEILHPPWELQTGEARVERFGMLEQLGLETPREEAVLHYSPRMDVVAWLPTSVDA